MKDDDMILVSSKGYLVKIIKRISTLCTDVVSCEIKGGA